MRAAFIKMMVEKANNHQKQNDTTSHKLIKTPSFELKRHLCANDDQNKTHCTKKMKKDIDGLNCVESNRLIAAQSLLEFAAEQLIHITRLEDAQITLPSIKSKSLYTMAVFCFVAPSMSICDEVFKKQVGEKPRLVNVDSKVYVLLPMKLIYPRDTLQDEWYVIDYYTLLNKRTLSGFKLLPHHQVMFYQTEINTESNRKVKRSSGGRIFYDTQFFNDENSVLFQVLSNHVRRQEEQLTHLLI